MFASWLQTPPDTGYYMRLGYAVIFIIQGLYLLSLWWRTRRLKREMDWLDELDSVAR